MPSPKSADPTRLRITIEAAAPHAVVVSGPGLHLPGAVPNTMLPGQATGERGLADPPRDATEILDDFRDEATPDLGRIGDAVLALLGLNAADQAVLAAKLRTNEEFELLLEPGPDWAAALPWEALRLPGNFLPALAPNIRFFREAPRLFPRLSPGPGPDASPPVPLRVLVVNSLPGPQPEPKAEYGRREVGLIRSLLWGAGLERHDVRVLSTADWTDAGVLVTAVQEFEPHVLHVVSHGDAGGGAEDARLLLGAHPNCHWTGDAILATFRRPPDLVVLHACWGGAQAANAGSIAQAFLRAGAGAVWSMQGNLDVTHAEPLAKTFYREWAKDGDVARAAAAARRQLVAAHGVARGNRAWAIPALTISTGARRLLPAAPCGRLRLGALEATHLPPLVDRKDCFAELWAPQNGVTVLSGPRQQGKSHLARWLVARAEAAGQRACRIEAGQEGMLEPVPLAALLEAALQGLWKDSAALPHAVCAFVHDYASLSWPNEREPPPMPDGWAPAGIRLQGDLRGQKKDQIFERFVSTLKASAPAEGLLLVIDLNQIDVGKGDLFPDLAERIILPWSRSHGSDRARLVIIMRDEQRIMLESVPGQPSSAVFAKSKVVSLPAPGPMDIRLALDELLDLADGVRAATGKSPLPSLMREMIGNVKNVPFAQMSMWWTGALEHNP